MTHLFLSNETFDPNRHILRADLTFEEKGGILHQFYILLIRFFTNDYSPKEISRQIENFYLENLPLITDPFKRIRFEQIHAAVQKSLNSLDYESLTDTLDSIFAMEQDSLYLPLLAKLSTNQLTQEDFVGELIKCQQPITELELQAIAAYFQGEEVLPDVLKFICDAAKSVTGVSNAIKSVSGSSSGVYFAGKERTIAVIKPDLEEAGAAHNRKIKTPLRSSTIAGDASKKEHIAYVIDKMEGGHRGVPITLRIDLLGRNVFQMAKAPSDRVLASIQQFCPGTPFENLSQEEREGIPQEEIERIAIEDCINGQLDRHFGNILYNQDSGRVSPIDHGLTRGNISGEMRMHWIVLPQASQPMTEKSKEFIRSIEPEIHRALLKEQNLHPQAIEEEMARIDFLKEAVEKELNFHDIAILLGNDERLGFCPFEHAYTKESRSDLIQSVLEIKACNNDSELEAAWKDANLTNNRAFLVKPYIERAETKSYILGIYTRGA